MRTNDNDTMIAAILAVVIGVAVLPSLLPKLGAQAGTWLIDHHVLVSPSLATLTVPGLNAGPDIRRLVIAAAALVVIAALAHRRNTTHQESA